MPWFWIVAGPNGAGKTTLVEKGIIQAITGRDLVTLNADVRTRELLAANPQLPDANLRAAIAIDARVAACIEQGVDVLVETVLSSDKYLDDVDRARSLGYQVGMIYVGLASTGDAVRRVALRHARGGHDVPTDKVVSRWSRSIAMLGRMAGKLDRLFVFDNTRPEGPRLIAFGFGRQVTLLGTDRIPEIDAVLLPAGQEEP
ncbi:MAG TPA: zeta toxin family protein [Acetobacteraceae bacterium]|nr:zeta toxin family protein [Acetobacteraceae bacterium]